MPDYRKILLAGFVLLTFSTRVMGQYPGFSSFWLSPQLVAPTAMAGSQYHQVTAHYRKQAFGENFGYRSLLLSSQFPVYINRNTQVGTLGVNLMQDESGTAYLFSTTGVMISYLYDVNLSSRHHLAGGVQGGYFSRGLNLGSVTTDNQFADGAFNPNLPHNEMFRQDQSVAFTTNVGLGYYLSDAEGEQLFHLGAGMINANKGRFTYLETDQNQAEPLKWVIYSNIRLLSTPSFEVVNQMYWREENQVQDFVGGFQFRKGINPRARVSQEHLGLGLYYTQDQTASISLQLARANLLVGLNYDLPFGSKVTRKVQNAAEVTLGWRMERQGAKRMYNSRTYGRKMPARKLKSKLPWEAKQKKYSNKKVKRKGAVKYKAKKSKRYGKPKKLNKKLPWNSNKRKVVKKWRRRN